MSHKRVVEKRGKSYGPYLYESYRDENGNVQKRYLGKVVEQQRKSIYVLAIAVAVLLTIILFSNFSITGRVTLSLDNIFVDGETLGGYLLFTLQQSELIPVDTQVVISHGGSENTYSLDELINESLVEGDFYLNQKEISGYGSGYGIDVERFPVVPFVLGIYKEVSSGTRTISDEVDEIPVEEEVISEVVEEETPVEEEVVEKIPSESRSIMTGQVSLELVEEVSGDVRANESFVYDLEEGQSAEIISSDEDVELVIENGQAIITTSYIGDETESIQIDVGRLNISAEEGDLTVSFVYDGVELFSDSIVIEFEEIVPEESVVDEEPEVPIESLTRETLDSPIQITSRINSTTVNDPLLGYCNASDADGDDLAYDYIWYNNSEVFVNATSFKEGSIAGNGEVGCGIRQNDSRVLCWGWGDYGALGDGITTGHDVGDPTLTTDNSSYISVSTSGGHTCGIRQNDSRILCWGTGQYGRLGDGSVAYHLVGNPTLTTDTSAYIKIDSGYYAHTCGIRQNDSRVLCWGRGDKGQLGYGGVGDFESPTLTTDTSAYISVTGGTSHTCGIRQNDSRVLCWGMGDYGQLGDGLVAVHNVLNPNLTTDTSAYVSISAGTYHTCGIRQNDSRVLCWGYGGNGRLGYGGSSHQGDPILINDTSAYISVDAGNGYTCGIRQNDSRVLCWGYGGDGSLGIGSIGSSLNPNITTDTSAYVSISAGDHTCGIRQNDSRVLCWGMGDYGQLGDGNISIHDVLNPNITTDNSSYGSGFNESEEQLISILGAQFVDTIEDWTFSCRSYDFDSYSSWVNSSIDAPLCVAGMSGGNTTGDPCLITNCIELQNMSLDLSGHFALNNSVDCSDTMNWNSGAGFDPVGDFAGTFNGQNYTITNLTIYRPSTNNIGLFGRIFGYSSNVSIEKVGLINVNITGQTEVGALAGYISNDVNVSYCHSSGLVRGKTVIGGLVGDFFYGSIMSNSYSSANLSYFTTGDYMGGLVGRVAHASLVNNSYATGNVISHYSGGGLVGEADGTNGGNITNSYATGDVSCSDYCGGLVGDAVYKSFIKNSFATGSVSNVDKSGGLIGYIGGDPNQGTIIDSYWNNHVGNPSNCYTYNILSTNYDGNDNCTSISNNESYFYLSNEPPMSTWDFIRIWQEETNDFPTLRAPSSIEGVLPNVTKFSVGNGSTDFSSVSDITNVTNMSLATSFGKIKFPETYGIYASGEDYDTNIEIGSGFISVNTAALHTSFNSTANVTINNVICPAVIYYGSSTYTTASDILDENNICDENSDPNCIVISCNENLTFTVSHFTGFASSGSTNLTIWDETDSGMPYGDQIKYADEQVKFFANYTNSSGPMSDATCIINFTGSTNNAMDWNSSGFYEYNRSFSSSGTYDYNVTCNKTGYSTLIASDNVTISSNTAPVIQELFVNTSTGNNLTSEDLICWANATDFDGNNLTYFGSWYKNGIYQVLKDWDAVYAEGTSDDEGRDIAVASSGNVYVTGKTSISGPGQVYYIIKYYPNGSQAWNATYDDLASLDPQAIALDNSENVYVTGYGGGWSYTVKYNSSGDYKWNITETYDNLFGIAVDDSGNIYVTGQDSKDYITVKYNPDKSVNWTATYDSAGPQPLVDQDIAYDIVVDNSGDVYVTGLRRYNNLFDIATVKYNGTDGSEIWNITYNSGSVNSDTGYGIAVDDFGYVYAVGVANNDYIIIKYNATDNATIWNTTYDGGSVDYARDIAIDGDGNPYVTGYSLSGANYNYLTIKYNATDNATIWNTTYDGGNEDRASGIALDNSGNIYVTGYAGNITGSGNNEFYTIKYIQEFTLENQIEGQLVNLFTLSNESTSVGDNWTCEVQAYDGADYSTTNVSDNLTVLAPVSACVAGMSGGNTTGDPCLVTNCIELQNMSLDLSGHFALNNSVDCSGTTSWDSNKGFNPIGCGSSNCGSRPTSQYFTGTFDGRNNTITDLYINRNEYDVGLFGYISGGANISYVGLEDVNITGWFQTGGLVGWIDGGSGIDNSYVTGSVIGADDVGGLVGLIFSGSVTNSYATGSVTGGGSYAGGLVGWSQGGIGYSYATGNVSGCSSYCGGLLGENYNGGYIGYSYATGNVSGSSSVGGLLGDNDAGGTVTNSYWNNHTGNPDVGVGSGTDATTVIQDNESYFFDISNAPMDVWSYPPWDNFCDDSGYPSLEWENITDVSDCEGYVFDFDLTIIKNSTLTEYFGYIDGTLTNVTLSNGNDSLVLSGSNHSGEFISQSFNFSGDNVWKNISWNEYIPPVYSFDSISSSDAYVYGILSNGTLYYSSAGSSTFSPVSFNEPFSDISTGFDGGDTYDFTCGILTNGTAYCWGYNGAGQLGVGDVTDRSSPTPINSTETFTNIDTGGDNGGLGFICAIEEWNGDVYCWGDDTYGQTGNGTSGFINVNPVLAYIPYSANYISAGGTYACASTSFGIYCWGDNFYGQLGNGSAGGLSTTPIASVAITGKVSAGEFHTCGLNSGGTAYCWGDNDNGGYLGDGTSTDDYDGVQVNIASTFQDISVGSYHTCGVLTNGSVYCWGYNYIGSLGNGTNDVFEARSPIPINSSETFTHVSVSFTDACALSTDNLVYCWGQDYGANPVLIGNLPTDITITTRLSENGTDWESWSSVYTNPGNITATSDQSYLQYRAQFSSNSPSPELYNVTIEYEPTCDYTISSCGQGISSAGLYCLNQSVSSLGDCLNISSNNVILDCKGYNLTGNTSGNGIYSNYSDTSIINCTVNNFAYGIRFGENTTGNTVRDNTIWNSSVNGLYFDFNFSNSLVYNNIVNYTMGPNSLNGLVLDNNSKYNEIYNNTIIATRNIGMWLGFISHNLIYNNTINGTVVYDGIYFNTTAVNNTIENNIIINTSTSGIWFEDSYNNTINNNYIEDVDGPLNEDGIHFEWSSGDVITNNYLTNLDGAGIYIYTDHASIINNTIYDIWGYGIDIDGTDTVIRNNNITYGYDSGIYSYYDLVNTTIEDNHIEDIGDYGIAIYESTNNTIDNNTIECFNYSDGIYFENTINDLVSNNNINEPISGVYVYYDAENITIVNNSFNLNWDNGEYGLYFDEDLINSLIENNTILDSYYNGIDIEGDSINNTYNNNDIQNTDYYDLIYMYSSTNDIISNNILYNSRESAIEINDDATNLTFENNDIYDTIEYGLEIGGYSINNTYNNNTIQDVGYDALYFYYGNTNDIISNNLFYVVGDSGIEIYDDATNLIIENNNITDIGEYGISFDGYVSTNSTIYNNTIHDTYYGSIYIDESYGDNVSNNILSLSNSDYAIYTISNTSGSSFVGNTIIDHFIGIYLEIADNVIIENNTIENVEYGIEIDNSTSNIINNNTISDVSNSDGIYLGNSTYDTISNNTLLNIDSIGIDISSSDYITISNNNISNILVDWDSIYLDETTNSIISNNILINSPESGIWIYTAENVTILNNTISNHINSSIRIDTSGINVTIKGNNVTNSSIGIYLNNVNNSLVYNNYFDNPINAYDNGNNSWNTTKNLETNILGNSYVGGNYWSDYSGLDYLNDDFIGDENIPYDINISNGGDYLPLTLYSCSNGGCTFVKNSSTTKAYNFANGNFSGNISLTQGNSNYAGLYGTNTSGEYISQTFNFSSVGLWKNITWGEELPPAYGWKEVHGAAYKTSCGIMFNGTAYCWGVNEYGRLGDGTTDNSLNPVPVNFSGNFSKIASGFSLNTCGLATNGIVYCWGLGSSGQLGDGLSTNSLNPVPVNISQTVKDLDSGGGHSCAVTTSGYLYCWGQNSYGKIGDGTTTGRPNPVLVSPSLNFTNISLGYHHTCGLLTNGTAYCWGYNYYGQLGRNTSLFAETNPSPSLVNTSLTFKEISAGYSHTCGLLTNGTAYCWGTGNKGQLGDGIIGGGSVNGDRRDYLILVNTTENFSKISSGPDHTCAITKNGTAYCWGYNLLGQLGTRINLTSFSNVPVPVNTTENFIYVGTGTGGGYESSFGISTQRKAYSWGGNDFGQLGFGYSDTSNHPDILLINNSGSAISGQYSGSINMSIRLSQNGTTWEGWSSITNPYTISSASNKKHIQYKAIFSSNSPSPKLFNVTINYGIGCGDGVCNGAETCLTCSADCGACPDGGGTTPCTSTGCASASTITCGQSYTDNCGASCGTGTKCDSGKTCTGGVCVSPAVPVCIGSIPTNANLCSGDNTDLIVNTTRTLVTICGLPKCEYTCDSGYVKSGSTCIVPVCEEDWRGCTWTECIGDDTISFVDGCVDYNNCGTQADKPTDKTCEEKEQEEEEAAAEGVEGAGGPSAPSCVSSWSCESWGECESDYTLEDVLNDNVNPSGTQRRTCIDALGCKADKVDKKPCAVSIPVEATRVDWCDDTYVEIYDKNTDKLVSRVKERKEILATKQIERLDISLITTEFTGYCDYCYDGVQNYDEEQVDCGGSSCPECIEKKDFFDWYPWLTVFLLASVAMLTATRVWIDRHIIIFYLRDSARQELPSYVGPRAPKRTIPKPEKVKGSKFAFAEMVRRTFRVPPQLNEVGELVVGETKSKLSSTARDVKSYQEQMVPIPKPKNTFFSKIKEIFRPRVEPKVEKITRVSSIDKIGKVKSAKDSLRGKGL